MNSYSATEKEEVLPLSHFEKGTILVDAIHPPKMPPLLPYPPPPLARWRYKRAPAGRTRNLSGAYRMLSQ